MTITVNTYDPRTVGGSWESVESLTHSTATDTQAISITDPCTVLGGTTATVGLTNGLYTLGTGIEGQEKMIYMGGTGQAVVLLTTQHTGRQLAGVSAVLVGGAATDPDTAWTSGTGRYVMQSGDDYILCRWQNAAWDVIEARGATLSTGT